MQSSKYSLGSEDKYTIATDQLLNGTEIEVCSYSYQKSHKGRRHVKRISD